MSSKFLELSPKFLEISSGQNSTPIRFEIVEVEKDNFMFKTKDSHVELLGTLQEWLKSNILMGESNYSVMLWERSSSMIKEAYKADDLLITGEGKLMHWSVSQKKVTKDYGGIMAGFICSMVQTSDKNSLFLSDNDGCLKQLDVKKQKVVRDYGKIHDVISSIATSSDDKFLFTSDFEESGHVKQFSVIDGKMIKD
jgi:hypothetical protein